MLRPIAEELHASVAQVALAWLLAKPAVTSVIIGAKNLSQLEDNIKAVDVTLSAAHLNALDQVSQLPPEYPGWMVPFQTADRLDPNLDLWSHLKDAVSVGK
ncbi:MAG: L-glyceraldehyde 3-phosphate reductase [bacterium ADurb.Bin425]|nr:MAG: L-glyceraldehyde 3-phosphate reductase [bacterium ADurb.Bin425]